MAQQQSHAAALACKLVRELHGDITEVRQQRVKAMASCRGPRCSMPYQLHPSSQCLLKPCMGLMRQPPTQPRAGVASLSACDDSTGNRL